MMIGPNDIEENGKDYQRVFDTDSKGHCPAQKPHFPPPKAIPVGGRGQRCIHYLQCVQSR